MYFKTFDFCILMSKVFKIIVFFAQFSQSGQFVDYLKKIQYGQSVENDWTNHSITDILLTVQQLTHLSDNYSVKSSTMEHPRLTISAKTKVTEN